MSMKIISFPDCLVQMSNEEENHGEICQPSSGMPLFQVWPFHIPNPPNMQSHCHWTPLERIRILPATSPSAGTPQRPAAKRKNMETVRTRTTTSNNQPTNQPTNQPSNQPTKQPTNQASNQPTKQPTNQPSNQPTNQRAAENTPNHQSLNLFACLMSTIFVSAEAPTNSAHWTQIELFLLGGGKDIQICQLDDSLTQCKGWFGRKRWSDALVMLAVQNCVILWDLSLPVIADIWKELPTWEVAGSKMYRPISDEYLTISRDISPFPLIYVVNWLHLISGHMQKKLSTRSFQQKTSHSLEPRDPNCNHPPILWDNSDHWEKLPTSWSSIWPEFLQRKKTAVSNPVETKNLPQKGLNKFNIIWKHQPRNYINEKSVGQETLWDETSQSFAHNPPCSKPENPAIDDWWTWFWEKKVTIEKKKVFLLLLNVDFYQRSPEMVQCSGFGRFRSPVSTSPKLVEKTYHFKPQNRWVFKTHQRIHSLETIKLLAKQQLLHPKNPPSFSPHSQGSDGSATGHSRRHFA